jgi:hypothetical protein
MVLAFLKKYWIKFISPSSYHGQIKAETQEDNGSEFTILLPVTIPVDQLTV